MAQQGAQDELSTKIGSQVSIELRRTDADDPALPPLIVELDNDLAVRDGNEHAFFAQFNKLQGIKHVVIAWQGDDAVGCGAFKPFEDGSVEIKRMFVPPVHRRKGIAGAVLHALEAWARECGYQRCVLETGKKQHEAVALYQRCGYRTIPNYGQYIGVESSVCFAKELT